MIAGYRVPCGSSSEFSRVPERQSSGSPVYNFRFRCLCKESISGSFRIEASITAFSNDSF